MSRPYHEHPIFGISNIGRPVDARFPTNRALLMLIAVAVVAGSAWGWVDGGTLGAAGTRGATLAVAVFGSWALGRELDPDNSSTAFVAVALMLGVVVLGHDVDLWTLLLALPLTRIVNRTIGPPARHTDLLLTLLIAGAVVFLGGRWSVGAALAIALACDAILPDGRADRWGFAAAAIAMLVTFHLQVGLAVSVPEATMLVSAVVLTTAAATATIPAVQSECDLPGYELRTRRVQAGILVALLLFVLVQFEAGAAAGLGLAATLAAVIPGRLLHRALAARSEWGEHS